jgi:D-serine deaminase-like pyridoxal phosphate-dependent protein
MLAFQKRLQALHITRPTLLLDKKRAVQNIRKMKDKADLAGVRLRPHFKTHQSAEVGTWFRRAGVDSITVSSLDMAQYFAGHGWEDINVAFTANMLEAAAINSLAPKVRLHLLVDSNELAVRLDAVVKEKVNAWIDVDVGYHRTGIPWDDFGGILSTARAILDSRKLGFCGLLTHSGDTYHARSVEEIEKIHAASLSRLGAAKEALRREGVYPCAISIGDTPSCSIAGSFAGADEIRPGNFVFYDLTMSGLGACRDEEIAVALACPVTAKYKSLNQVVIYGGAVHLSKEFMVDERGRGIYGYPARPAGSSWGPAERKAPVVSLSQEHGLIQTNDSLFEQIKIGDLLVILPVHSCLTADLYRSYLTLDGERIERRQSNDSP